MRQIVAFTARGEAAENGRIEEIRRLQDIVTKARYLIEDWKRESDLQSKYNDYDAATAYRKCARHLREVLDG